MSNDDPRPSSNRPAAHLLNELESIKGVLTDDRAMDTELPTDIPLLDDMVIDNLDSNAKLLNIGQIFDDDAPAVAEPPMQFPRFTLDVTISDDSEIATEMPTAASVSAPPISTPPTSSPARGRADYSREVLIQELVDEFIPQIEAELHKRLRQLNDATLRRLKDTK
jgi:hypothetical protein